jgi:hypothetical protein
VTSRLSSCESGGFTGALLKEIEEEKDWEIGVVSQHSTFRTEQRDSKLDATHSTAHKVRAGLAFYL